MARGPEPGDEARRVVQAYANTILRLSYVYLRSTEDAEDICQEVLLKLLQREDGFESPEHERAWVVRVCANACKDLLRRRNVRAQLPLEDVSEPADPSSEDWESAWDGEQSILAAVSSLPPDYREAIYLHYYENMSVAAIAEATGCSESAVSQRLHRARVQLKGLLERSRS